MLRILTKTRMFVTVSSCLALVWSKPCPPKSLLPILLFFLIPDKVTKENNYVLLGNLAKNIWLIEAGLRQTWQSINWLSDVEKDQPFTDTELFCNEIHQLFYECPGSAAHSRLTVWDSLACDHYFRVKCPRYDNYSRTEYAWTMLWLPKNVHPSTVWSLNRTTQGNVLRICYSISAASFHIPCGKNMQ